MYSLGLVLKYDAKGNFIASFGALVVLTPLGYVMADLGQNFKTAFWLGLGALVITWFIYSIYLHARYVRGWKGTQMAIISAVGFIGVIFTYLGVNLVLSGLHAYGGIN